MVTIKAKQLAKFASILCVIPLSVSLISIVSSKAAADEMLGTQVMLIERGIVLNPEILTANDSSASIDSQSLDLQTPEPVEDNLQLQPTWQHPDYSTQSQTTQSFGVWQTSCGTTQYKVISKVSGQQGGGYIYDCWTGSGIVTYATPFPTYGAGVERVCPGNNRGRVHVRPSWGGTWYWTVERTAQPNNSVCYGFQTYMMYDGVRLNY
jgi:hypothetical protein